MQILVISTENTYAVKRLRQEAKALKVKIKIVSAEGLARNVTQIKLNNYSVLYIRNPYANGKAEFLPQIIRLAKKFKKRGKRVVDAAVADGFLGQGKWVDYRKLIKAGLPVPKTQRLSGSGLTTAPYPLILKWIYGFKGQYVFLVKTRNDLKQVLLKHPKKELLAQQFIDAQFEYKVMTVGYKALPIILKFAIHPQTHRPDFEKFEVIKISKQSSAKIFRLIKLAEKASWVLKRELAKVDILEARAKFYILEVNRFPGLDSFEILTKYNVSKKFLEYLQKPKV